jgi:hypothetical protein
MGVTAVVGTVRQMTELQVAGASTGLELTCEHHEDECLEKTGEVPVPAPSSHQDPHDHCCGSFFMASS